jgi:hypothetical protein
MNFSQLIVLFTGLFLIVFAKYLANKSPLQIWILDISLSPVVSRFLIILFGLILLVLALLTSQLK